MFTDIFRFNISNTTRNLMIIVIFSILLQKCLDFNIFISVRANMRYSITTMMIILIIGAIPGRLIIQGGMNIWYILLIGVIFRFIRTWSTLKHYKITPSSPMMMIPVIIIIEFIRTLIRPISLILRILINLSIGHIVIYMLSFPLSIFYNLVEIFIYSIQIYIFWTLILIYSK